MISKLFGMNVVEALTHISKQKKRWWGALEQKKVGQLEMSDENILSFSGMDLTPTPEIRTINSFWLLQCKDIRANYDGLD